MARRFPSRTSIALAIAALVHVAVFAIWRGGEREQDVRPEPARELPRGEPLAVVDLSTVSLVALPPESQNISAEGADQEWAQETATAPPSPVVAAGSSVGRRARGELGAPAASARSDSAQRSTGLLNSARQSQHMAATAHRPGITTPEKLERDTTRGGANRARTRAQARPGHDADRVGMPDGVGSGGAPGSDGQEWLSADPRFDSAPRATRALVVGAAMPNAQSPRRTRGATSTENSERGPVTGPNRAAELSMQSTSSAFDLGAPSAGGQAKVGAGGQGASVADQGGRGRAARSGTSAGNAGSATRATRSNPYFYEMYKRIDEQLKFPRKLAVALEQGEVVLRFRLDAKGRVHGLTIAKSSEFDEFDAEALRAFRAAGPFGEVPKALLAGRDRLSVVAPYYFRNPLIR